MDNRVLYICVTCASNEIMEFVNVYLLYVVVRVFSEIGRANIDTYKGFRISYGGACVIHIGIGGENVESRVRDIKV